HEVHHDHFGQLGEFGQIGHGGRAGRRLTTILIDSPLARRETPPWRAPLAEFGPPRVRPLSQGNRLAWPGAGRRHWSATCGVGSAAMPAPRAPAARDAGGWRGTGLRRGSPG